jgi:hypothetical protein
VEDESVFLYLVNHRENGGRQVGETATGEIFTDMADESRRTITWKWRARGKLNPEWRELAWRMTEQEAVAWTKAHGRDIKKIEGSAEERPGVYSAGGIGAPESKAEPRRSST